jgi:hypothetical protein
MQLDVDMGKQKTALRKRGSLAKRRKPSRTSIHSMGEAGEDSHFTDSTSNSSHVGWLTESSDIVLKVNTRERFC